MPKISTTLLITLALLIKHPTVRAEVSWIEAGKIASTKAAEMQVPASEYRLSRISFHTEPDEIIPPKEKGVHADGLRKALKGKHFWVVYWGPLNQKSAGGDFTVILDAADGTVLSTFRGR